MIGEPGVGKSTLLAGLVTGARATYRLRPVAHADYGRAAQIGVIREGFAGTDGLALNAQPAVLEWLARYPFDYFVAEGDRLANAKFFTAVQALGYRLTVAALLGAELAAVNREKRAQVVGRAQNDTWVRGRATKVDRLLGYAHPGFTFHIRTAEDYITAAGVLAQHPVIRAITDSSNAEPE